nr:acylphosphatase [Nakamurella antarctica]
MSDSPPDIRMTMWVHGHVQGVGFRWWTRARALELHLVGSARNLSDGRVEVVAQGPEVVCRGLLALLRNGDTPGRVDVVVELVGVPKGPITGFVER